MNEWSLITLSSWRWTIRKTEKAASHHLSRAFISACLPKWASEEKRLFAVNLMLLAILNSYFFSR